MLLTELINDIAYQPVQGELRREISALTVDSRKAVPGCIFLCISGYQSDGHRYIADVANAGAAAIVIEKDVDLTGISGVTVIKVPDTRSAMARISAAYYGYPAKELKLIGITGTKGKSTTSYMIKRILEEAGHKVGLIGTIEIIIDKEHIPASNTTPDSYLLHAYLRRMADAGITYVVMETASQGFKLKRTEGIQFDIGIFTNLSPDHIGPNEHESFEEYLECKSMLFRQCRLGIINADDPYALKVIKGRTCELITYGFHKEADFYAEHLTLLHKVGELGIEFTVQGECSFTAEVSQPGRFSVYNALAAIAAAHQCGVSTMQMQTALADISVKGRIENVKTPYDFTLLIDYAHNAMSLESILITLREYEPARLIVLFGCGGNRSRERRFSMGETAGRLADLTIITSDNPRNEEPQAIMDDIKTGMLRTNGKFVELIDRKDAIRYAIDNGRPGDIIVLAGKGHEDYQEVKGIKYPMDERVLVREILSEKE